MNRWPTHLIKEIAERRCIFFLGSGVSASAKDLKGNHPKTWGDLLSAAVNLIGQQDHKTFVNELIETGHYLLALQCIYDHSDKGDYLNFLRNEYLTPRFEPSDVHNYIVDIDPKIVITTNFDVLYEQACGPYGYITINYYDNNLIDSLRSDDRIIIKAHGTISNPNRMIFTKREYFNAKRDYSEFYTILSALFITNTIIFIGCSLDDPDISLLLESVYNITRESKPHYILTKEDINENIERDWKNSYNISVLRYGSEYSCLTSKISLLKDQVLSYRDERGIR